ncbi:MAG: hypothetical protein GY845_24105 [Planctomycetes bacterium]|nr:hypothetical protein [Planctomycetota bacterium]
MMTESNKNQRNDKKTKLTGRQLKAMPLIVASPTYTEGCKRAKLNRTTFYKWLKIPEFKAEFDRQRDEIVAEAFGVLSQGLTKAVETLVSLLDNKDDRLKRLVAKDVIDFIIRHKENEDLDERLTAIEQRLVERLN